MAETKSLYDLIKSDTLDFLCSSKQRLTAEEVKEYIDDVIRIKSKWTPHETVDSEALYREVASLYSVWSGDETILDNNEDHIEWLPEQHSAITWKFWKRYVAYLLKEKSLPPDTVDKTDRLTGKILERLEWPKRPGSWDRRGMVVGDVQSGKTSNFTGLICKAADAGYKYIIVLSGMTDDLRSQTQKRLDAGFLGYDSVKRDDADQSKTRIGVGLLPEFDSPIVHSVTNSELDGDFNKKVFKQVSVRAGNDPILFVVKKNASVLKNLYKEFTRYASNGKVRNMPLLVIDDEADNASVDGKAVERDDTGKPIQDRDPAKINGWIRKILRLFAQSAYVGYTATPFANIFIFPRSENDPEEYGEDLFPRSFIINLPSPDNYMGPVQVFGLNLDKTDGSKIPGLPIIKTISDYESNFPRKHQKDLIVSGLPNSLYYAIKCYIITCAGRAARGQRLNHNSMLVHVTRYNDVQMQIKDLISHEVERLQRIIYLATKDKLNTFYDELEYIWNTEFSSKYQEICSMTSDVMCTPLTWDMVKTAIPYACGKNKLVVKAINGISSDGGLNYDDYEDGLNVIAIGGDKLSRGLTLENLSISYYTRASKMYDTLLQMGRWFGYKTGFIDLCRLFTSTELVSWYQHITAADEELKREFDQMAKQGSTPEEYGLRVRTHPDGLLITSTNKMRNSKTMSVTFSGQLVEIARYHRKDSKNRSNYEHLQKWLPLLGTPAKVPNSDLSGQYVWGNVSVQAIIEFFDGYIIHPMSQNANPEFLKEYIAAQNNATDKSGRAAPELTNWTVALISSGIGTIQHNIGGYEVKLPLRRDMYSDGKEEATDDIIMLTNRRLITQDHETIDISAKDYQEAMADTISDWQRAKKEKKCPEKPSPQQVRNHRPITDGLLLIYPLQIADIREEGYATIAEPVIGYAVSFPTSRTAKEIEYKANNTYWRNLYESED